MPKIKFNKTIISKLECPENKQEEYYWDIDGNPAGFGIKVRKTGFKSYIYQYRVADSTKVRKIKIGSCGSIMLDVARTKAMKFAKQVVIDCEDPVAVKKQIKKSLTSFKEATEKYIEEYSKQANKIKTVKDNQYKFDKVLIPFFKGLSIDKIEPSHIADLKYKMKDTQVYFNRCYALLSKLFNLCEIWGFRPRYSNPCMPVKKYNKAEKKRGRFLSYEELQRIFTTLHEARYTSSPELQISEPIINLIYLLIYTGARKGEVLQFRWDKIDWKKKRVEVDSKTGDLNAEANFIDLSEYTIGILKHISKAPYIPVEQNGELVKPYIENGKKYSPFVISSPRTGLAYNNPTKGWRKLLQIANIKDNLRIHDLRHSFASFSADVGINQKMTGRMLRHSSLSTTQRYVHLFDNKINQATNKIGEHINSFDPNGDFYYKKPNNTININNFINLTKKKNLG